MFVCGVDVPCAEEVVVGHVAGGGADDEGAWRGVGDVVGIVCY